MLKETMQIKNPSGLHMRPAGLFVKEALKFGSEALFYFKGKEYNAKSMISVLGAAVKYGDEIELVITGDDEAACMEAVKKAVEGGLGE